MSRGRKQRWLKRHLEVLRAVFRPNLTITTTTYFKGLWSFPLEA